MHIGDSPLLDDSVLFNDGWRTPGHLSASKLERTSREEVKEVFEV